MTCEERKDLMFDYLTGALDAAEELELRRHLAGGCPACAGALAEAQATLAALPLALEPVQPSPASKQRLMDRIAAHPRGVNGIGAVAPTQPASPAPVAPDRLPDSAAMRLFRVLVPAAVAAGIAIILTHAFVMRKVQPELVRGQASQQLVEARDQRIRSLLETVANQRRVVEMLHAPDLKFVELKGDLQPSARARLLWDQKASKWLLLATGMTPLPPEKTYELWYIPEGNPPVRAGEFNVTASGEGSVMTTLPANLGKLAVAAITDEPAGGLDNPSGTVQLKGTLQ